jgi:CDP-diacylglycerol pyrophosphatase
LLAIALVGGPTSHLFAADPDALWRIVSGQCVPDQQQHLDPAPCALVDLTGGIEHGYVILKDRVGVALYLLMPTAKITGIESPLLLNGDQPNYFAEAWRARGYVEARLGRQLPGEDIGLAVNSFDGRTQNQLHIHIDCLRSDVRDTLAENLALIGPRWAPLQTPLAGHQYLAMRLDGDVLSADPFSLLADGVPGARDAMGSFTLVVAGAKFGVGHPGFVLLADRADLAAGDRASGESLQDHDCSVALH